MTDRTANTAMQVRENGLVSQSGGLLLAETLRATGLGQGPAAAGRLARSGRRLRLRLAATWRWATQLTTAITRTRGPSRLADHHQSAPATRKDKPSARGTPPTRRDSREAPARPGAEDQQTAAVPAG